MHKRVAFGNRMSFFDILGGLDRTWLEDEGAVCVSNQRLEYFFYYFPYLEYYDCFRRKDS